MFLSSICKIFPFSKYSKSKYCECHKEQTERTIQIQVIHLNIAAFDKKILYECSCIIIFAIQNVESIL